MAQVVRVEPRGANNNRVSCGAGFPPAQLVMSRFLGRPVVWFGGTWLAANLFAVWFLGLWHESPLERRKSYVSARAEDLYERPGVLPSPAGKEAAEATGPNVLTCRVLRPAMSTSRFPLVVFLHGAGERGHNNVSQLSGLPDQLAEPEMQSRFPCVCLVPQCPSQGSWGQHMDELERLVEHWRADPQVDPCRVYLTGLSMGGFGSWELAARRPELFAAVVPICGGGEPVNARFLTDLPIWAVHGEEDEVVPVSQTRRMIEAVRSAGGEPRYTELPGVGHNSWTPAYRDPDGVIPWMFRQARQDCPRSTPSRWKELSE